MTREQARRAMKESRAAQGLGEAPDPAALAQAAQHVRDWLTRRHQHDQDDAACTGDAA